MRTPLRLMPYFVGKLRQFSAVEIDKFVGDIRADNQYELPRESIPCQGVPEGTISEFSLVDSKIYPGRSHQGWLYVPAQYDGKAEIPLMIFMDGELFVEPDGGWRVPLVLDNLIARKELPIMASVFIEPGPEQPVMATQAPDGSSYLDTTHRGLEYDTLDATYANFLLEELFPKVRQHVRITDQPEGRGLAGASSGGICAFTAAWQRPDQFRKVLSVVGSCTNKRGGNQYPHLVRESAKKPIRIWQQSGERDLVHPSWGAWSEANKAMAAALEAKGYDHQFVFGEGPHEPAHASSLFPQAMRWLWRDYPARWHHSKQGSARDLV